jgi:hypothetical protein
MAVTAVVFALLLNGTLPLVVGKITTGPKSTVELRNAGNQPVTAWSFAAVTHTADGRTHRDIYTTDGYLGEITAGLPGGSAVLNRLLPGESRIVPVDPLAADAAIEVAAVVLDDGDAGGDEGLIDSIFEHRVQERDGLQAVVDAFHDVLSSQRGRAALDALHDRLGLVMQRDPSVPCQAAFDAIETYRQRAAAAGADTLPDIDTSVRTYMTFVEREYQLAQKHAQRKNTAVKK